ncbi:hypothetical protein RFI_21374 [Reticulomyxa filosa]|uniref:Uncharacterized protein n=1 Tax=Reticulomyxa filosa TaxID=46433 RepID=X6MRC6_RETFI|nr:hypothetical protein RFI_21374 [Reticulomyxa filosa]|eukprot:ETO15987.1 hypothetical protein RFI_21374 [Reticulomyxa filosa]
MYHENRAFKLVFNVLHRGAINVRENYNGSSEMTKFIRPLESHAFKLVKHRLEISKEPADRFYKDEGGRNNCLNVVVHLKDSQHNIDETRDKIPLTLRLVYDDNSQAQSQRDILEVLTINFFCGDSLFDVFTSKMSKFEVVCAVWIFVLMKYPKTTINELLLDFVGEREIEEILGQLLLFFLKKKAFRLVVECASDNALYHDISGVMTRPVMVYSKRTKKGKRGTSPVEQLSNAHNGNNSVKRAKFNATDNVGHTITPKPEQSGKVYNQSYLDWFFYAFTFTYLSL